ncbi:hypothetical protein BDP81DRAFT_74725 [Colletotrichum phormii]|uniref:Uncharacterized protein n=1 Tax=Colletotrichum phormii TaxID=359342 RepID=A0AAJ0EDD3_9PEZI|nr:uncharacterized protein BDP81DRAFT_74725 [Colletotrichum phormii]KAK1625593.1 hypothetical protein BDP81DRAFT_74725 [Colletotrichum phormii]
MVRIWPARFSFFTGVLSTSQAAKPRSAACRSRFCLALFFRILNSQPQHGPNVGHPCPSICLGPLRSPARQVRPFAALPMPHSSLPLLAWPRQHTTCSHFSGVRVVSFLQGTALRTGARYP